MGRTSTTTDRRARRYIRITDELKWEYIDRIMQRGEYKKSFNKVINDALDYGLPELLKVSYGEIEDDGLPTDEVQEYSHTTPQRIVVETVDDRVIAEMIDLLEEIVLNTSISKSLIASLFNERAKNLYGYSVRPELFENGDMRDTPDYLAEHERMVLKRINTSRKKRQ